ncbi:MAG TPA: glutaredoxin 3 [Gammaproteobacteria bacterium]|nr:glutaredoxin 3 [Gammaproteobacteria bacterium]
MPDVTIYTTSWCGFCRRAKALLDEKGVTYHEIDVEAEPGGRAEMAQRSGRRTVPQIFIDGLAIGGCDDLYALDATGQLDKLLNTSNHEPD